MHANRQFLNKRKQILKISWCIRQEMLHEFRSNTDHCKLVFYEFSGCKEALANLPENRNMVKGQLTGLKKELDNRPQGGQKLE